MPQLCSSFLVSQEVLEGECVWGGGRVRSPCCWPLGWVDNWEERGETPSPLLQLHLFIPYLIVSWALHRPHSTVCPKCPSTRYIWNTTQCFHFEHHQTLTLSLFLSHTHITRCAKWDWVTHRPAVIFRDHCVSALPCMLGMPWVWPEWPALYMCVCVMIAPAAYHLQPVPSVLTKGRQPARQWLKQTPYFHTHTHTDRGKATQWKELLIEFGISWSLEVLKGNQAQVIFSV